MSDNGTPRDHDEDHVVLEACDLRHSFGDAPVLKGVSLSLERGQITLLMGPSGSGKSTLLAVLSGLLRPNQGEVWVRPSRGPTLPPRRNLWEMSDVEREEFRRRHCGFIFQGHNLFPALTAQQQLELVLRWGQNLQAGDARNRAEDMLKQLDLWGGQQNKRPLQLSGGEKQRVAIGRALIKEPVFCFADEPTSALDWNPNGQLVAQKLRTLANEHDATVLMVSHDHRLRNHVDRVIFMDNGTVADRSDDCNCPVCHRPFNGEEPEGRPRPADSAKELLRSVP